jgi:hypothetical protein
MFISRRVSVVVRCNSDINGFRPALSNQAGNRAMFASKSSHFLFSKPE